MSRQPHKLPRCSVSTSAVLPPKQFIGTSIVIRTDADSRRLAEESVQAGFEPHYVVMKGRHGAVLKALAKLYGFAVYEY